MALRSLDLMIGDWLYYKGQFNAFPFKVESITKKKVGYHAEPNEHRMYYLRLSECKPIPLTPEILEKNGFKRDIRVGYCEQYAFCDNLKKIPQTVIEFSFYEEGMSAYTLLRAWTKPESCDGENSVHICDLKYVHQLQHVLRLCGITLNIEV